MATRRLLLGAALAAPAFAPALAQAPAWPQRPVRFVVAAAPGGTTDLIARLLAEHLGGVWGQTVLVENRPGAGGNVGAQLVARAAPDGYAALFTTTAFAINLSLFRNPGYSAEQFLPAAVIAGTPTVFIVRADSPFRTLRDLVETARRRPVTYGTPGAGTAAHLSAGLLFNRAGAPDSTPVPYAGSGPALTAVLAGDIDVALIGLAGAVPHIRGGRLRGLAVTSERRSQALPDVPTVAQAELEPLVDITWVGMFFPAGTPRPPLDRANADVLRLLELPAFQQRLAAMDLEPIGGDLPAAQAFVASEIARWRDIVRAVNVQLD